MSRTHPKAEILNEYGDRTGRMIDAEKLTFASVLADAREFARQRRLVCPNTDDLLFVRRSAPPVFFARSRYRRLFRGRSKPSEFHKETIEKVQAYLLRHAPVRVGMTAFENRKPVFEELAEVTDYLWQTEVTYPIGDRELARFDLFGCSKDLTWTASRPHVAVEVVHTHFHDELTFNALLAQTARTPLLVVYYFIQFAPRLNRLDNTVKDGGRIWTACVLEAGRVWWDNDSPDRLQTYAGLQRHLDCVTNREAEKLQPNQFSA